MPSGQGVGAAISACEQGQQSRGALQLPHEVPGIATTLAKEAADIRQTALLIMQGVVRLLRILVLANKRPPPIEELKTEFEALWKARFALQLVAETDAVTFLQKFPAQVAVLCDSRGDPRWVRLCTGG